MSSQSDTQTSNTDTESMMASALLKIRSEAIPSPSRHHALRVGESNLFPAVFPARPGVVSAQQLAALQMAAGVRPCTVSWQNLIALLPSGAATQAELGALSQQPIGVRTDLAGLVQTTVGASPESRKLGERSQVVIRQDEIEAAFQSRPQRGRKRENLSELERLELTRTRNRMHAQSTRVRKKARYQELLDKEVKLRQIESVENLQQNRRQTVLQFLAIRERMLRSLSPGDDCNSNGDAQYHESLTTVIANLQSFAFHTNIFFLESTDCMAQMKSFDDGLRSKAAAVLEASDWSTLSYRLEGAGRNIALDLENSGFLEVSIGVSLEPVSLVSALLKVVFEPSSPRLVSVSWITLEDSRVRALNEPLVVRNSHPSVVSLDPVITDVGKDSAESSVAQDHDEEDHGPGMEY